MLATGVLGDWQCGGVAVGNAVAWRLAMRWRGAVDRFFNLAESCQKISSFYGRYGIF